MAKSTEKAGARDGSATRRSQGVQSVGKALAILELFGEDRPTLSISEIAAGAGLNRATTYRFCQTLLELGYLESVGKGELRPGLKAVSLATAALGSRELPDLAVPYLRDLQSRTDETVNMALLDGDEVVYVARLLSDHLLALRLFIGSRLPAFSSSLGRAILAFLPDEEVDAMLEQTELKAATDRSITDPEKLRAALRKVRSRGYAINDQELVIGVTGVAAPIFGVADKPLAAINISISHPVRMSEIEEDLAPLVLQTARSISDLAGRLALDSV